MGTCQEKRRPCALIFVLVACGGPRGAVESPQAAPVRAVAGGRAIVAEETGIFLVDVGEPMGLLLTVERGRHLRLDGEWLYFFDPAAPVLRAVHLHQRGTTRVVLELRPIDQPGFRGGDPLVFLRRQEDLDVRGGILCMDLRGGGSAGGL